MRRRYGVPCSTAQVRKGFDQVSTYFTPQPHGVIVVIGVIRVCGCDRPRDAKTEGEVTLGFGGGGSGLLLSAMAMMIATVRFRTVCVIISTSPRSLLLGRPGMDGLGEQGRKAHMLQTPCNERMHGRTAAADRKFMALASDKRGMVFLSSSSRAARPAEDKRS